MKRTKGEFIFTIINTFLIILLCVITFYPYINQLAVSLNQGTDTIKGGITIFPRKFTIENYKTVFGNSDISSAALISVSIVILYTLISMTVTFAAAYGLSKRKLPYRRFLNLFILIPGYISFGIIPTYILYRYLHLINNYFVYIIPGIFSFYNMIIIRSYIQELPESVEESAMIDGANEFQIMYKIIFPMSLPVVATVSLWLMVGQWNNWTTTLYYVVDKELYTLQYLMMRLIKESEAVQKLAMESTMYKSANDKVATVTSDSVKAATLMITTLPIIMVYPFLQKYFIKGVTLGAVKG